MAGEFQVVGKNGAAPFSLKVHRGDGMALLAMNWRNGQLFARCRVDPTSVAVAADGGAGAALSG